MITEEKKAAILSLKKAKSHIEKVISMIETDEYCVDIMSQNLAVVGLLKSAHQKLMENHLKTCFSKAMESKLEKRKLEMIDEIIKVMKISNK